MTLKLNQFSLVLVMAPAILLSACGGGGGGDSTIVNPSPVGQTQLSAQDLLNLYPTFYRNLGIQEASFFAARGLYNPLMSNWPMDSCQQGSAASDWAPGAVPSSFPAVAHVSYSNCITTVNLTVPSTGQTMTLKIQRDGIVTYKLDSASGDYQTTRKAVNANMSIGLNGFKNITTITIGAGTPLVANLTLSGTYNWIFTNYDLQLDTGTQNVYTTSPLTLVEDINGHQFTGTIKPSHSTWNLTPSQVQYVSQFTRSASVITLVGQGPFAGEDIVLTNLTPAVYPLPDPTAIIETDVSKINIYSQPASGLEVLAYGISRVYITYLGKNLLMQLDLNGDGCIESTATLTSAQLNNMMNVTQLPTSMLVPVTGGSCVPVPTS